MATFLLYRQTLISINQGLKSGWSFAQLVPTIWYSLNLFRPFGVRTLPFTFCFSFLLSSNAQEITGTIADSSVFNSPVFLWETIGNHSYKIDSAIISSNGKLFFTHKNYPAGYYFLSLHDTNRVDLIISPSEKVIELQFSDKLLQNGIQIISSSENKVLWEYKLISKKVYQELKNIYIQKSYIPIPPVSVTDSIRLEQLQHLEDSLHDYKLLQLKKLCEQAPSAYFAKSARAALRKKYSSKEEEKKHFFETVDFADASLIRSIVFPNNIMDYLQTFTEFHEAGFKSSVDTILILAKANPDVYEFCLNFLMEVFERVGPDIIFQYLTEQYFIGEGCSELNLSETFKTKAEAYRLLLPGNKAPDVPLKDTSENEVNLSLIAGKNKITILFFWSSHCSFCHKAITDMQQIYSAYHAIGLEIVAFSLDENENEWKRYITENQLKWLNFSELKGWKSPVVDKFKIHKTPSFYVLNNHAIILSKPTIENLKKEVEKYF